MFLGVMRWRQRSPRRPLAPRELSDAWTRECGLGVLVICNWEQAHDDWAREFDLIVNCCDGQASYKRPVSLVCSVQQSKGSRGLWEMKSPRVEESNRVSGIPQAERWHVD